MMTIRQIGIGVAGVVLAVVLATSARASLVIETVGDIYSTGSWNQDWSIGGGYFDKVVATRLAGNDFEGHGLFTGMTGWESSPRTIKGSRINSINFTTIFNGHASDLPLQCINLKVYDADVLLCDGYWQWCGNKWDNVPVPEPTTMIAGALLLLPFGASTLRILRKRQTA
jgi:hypothetical protein